MDQHAYTQLGLISYAAKYASTLYAPFREALQSNPASASVYPKAAPVLQHKRSYQLNPANRREALVEAQLDTKEGADILLVKPGLFYLDILRDLRESSLLPLAVYNVSGEYVMLRSLLEKYSHATYRDSVLETLLAFKRAGADLIFTYHAKEAAQWLAK